MQFVTLADDSSTSKVVEMLVEVFMAFVSVVLAVSVITFVTDHKFDKLKSSGAPWKQNFVTMADRDKQLSCLAMNIYKEAGYESFEGKVAVAQVTLNRAASGQFPSEICQVVYQKNIVYEKVVCQFSWYCDGTHRQRPVNDTVYQESYDVAKRVLLENFRLPGLNSALYYHADYVNPRWNKEKITKIGRHIFYKDKSKDI
jgi:spore germination cell wall hydrolase CwlJ-like protein